MAERRGGRPNPLNKYQVLPDLSWKSKPVNDKSNPRYVVKPKPINKKAPKKPPAPVKKKKKKKSHGKRKKKPTPPRRRTIRRKRNPKKPKYVVKTSKSARYLVQDVTSLPDQSEELLNSYLSLAATELFQYINTQTIDGARNNVFIIDVLSQRRRAYTPNRIIEQASPFIKNMWIQGTNLYIDVDDSHGYDDITLYFNTVLNVSNFAETID